MKKTFQSVLVTGLKLTEIPVVFTDSLCFIGDMDLCPNDESVLKVFKSIEEFENALREGGTDNFAIAAYRYSSNEPHIIVNPQTLH